MNTRTPRVSIGLPVYNGENFLEAALDSILAQSYQGFELIVSDNASTDRTREICETYAAQDKRIRYVRNEVNTGSARNFNHTFELARGEFFKWAAHDDIMEPEFIKECVEALDSDPNVVLAYPKARLIDDNGAFIKTYDVHLDTDVADVRTRFDALLWANHLCYEVFGLIRSDILRQTSLIEPYTMSDRVLLLGLTLFGTFHETPGYQFSPRRHAANSHKSHKTRHTMMAWFDSSKRNKIVLPAWILLRGYLRAIRRPPLKPSARVYCYRQMAKWSWKYRSYLWKDVILAAKQIIHRTATRLKKRFSPSPLGKYGAKRSQ